MDDLSKARLQMVQHQIAARGIRNLLCSMSCGRLREFFVPPHLAEFAYLDTPLPIESGQTISQPYIVALMIESLQPRPGDRALEIGTGSGYAAAVLAQLVSEVYTVERDEQLVELARKRFDELGYTNIKVLNGDGTLGWPEYAPYDVIVVTAGDLKNPSHSSNSSPWAAAWSFRWAIHRGYNVSCESLALIKTNSMMRISARCSSFH
jgi:protein-L-isoaspartate(D-aspartate) O-methyltransferase